VSRLVCTVVTGIVVGIVFAPSAARAASRDLSLPDISTAFEPIHHLDLKGGAFVDGMAPDLPAERVSGLGRSLEGVYAGIGRNDGRSRPRPAPRPRPRPVPHTRYHVHVWVPVAIVLAVTIAICVPMVMVVYY